MSYEITCESVQRWIDLNKKLEHQYARVVTKHVEFGRVVILEDRSYVLIIEYPHRKSSGGGGDSKWVIKREVIPKKDVVELRYYQD